MRTLRPSTVLSAFAAALALSSSSGCTKEGCLAGDEGCVVPSPCQALAAPSCDDDTLFVRVIEEGDPVPGGIEAFGAIGDVMIGNSRITAVIDALENENYIGMSGGFLLDLSTTGDDNDSLNQIVHAVGFLPEDSVVYTSMEILEGDGFKAVQVKGHLAGDVRQKVYSRYEVRPCEPGIRVRTEMVNGGVDDGVWGNLDGFWWGGRQNWGFSPSLGAGFHHPSFTLSTVNDVFKRLPFLAASSWVEPAAAYATVGCNLDHIEGFQSETVTGFGGPRSVVRPGDYLVYERVHLAASGTGVSPAANLALEVRKGLFGEEHTELSGRVTVGGAAATLPRDRAIVQISEGRLADPPALRTPWTVVVPASDGSFSARVPADKEYVVEVIAFGEVAAEKETSVGRADVDVGELDVAAGGELTLGAQLGGVDVDAMIWILPADDETDRNTRARFLGMAPDECAPLLAYPYGPSPACNRLLTKEPVTVEVPPGSYDVFASIGPFATVAKQSVVVEPGSSEAVTFALQRLPVTPPGTLSADFHVHGSKSFDTMFPNLPRVQSFLAAGVDVIAATEHDAVGDWSDAMRELGITDELILMPGLETTGFVLWYWNPDNYYPQVVGHWNFWPLTYRPDRPKDGAPGDELAEPGTLFMRAKQAELPEYGVIQLNHPYSSTQFGRDYGWISALDLDLNVRLPLYDDGTGAAFFHRQPDGALFRNSDYHTQEVMTSTRMENVLQNRAFWFYALNQGFLRAGTGNSDSHSLTDNLVGVPRTLVWTPTTRQDFDEERFNLDVRAGRMIGTNGPVIDARVVEPSGNVSRPSLEPFTPASGSELRISVSAAPWVYIEEIRVIVNGVQAFAIESVIENAASPYASEPVQRYAGLLAVDDLLPGDGRDAWIVVEAGAKLPLLADLDCDGAPDTSDNNGDDVVDWRDVDRNGDARVTDGDLDADRDGTLDEEPAACSTPVGPLLLREPPARDADSYPFHAVTDGSFPMAFTNPFVVDTNGDGFEAPGL